jgi:VWFA-related protein
MSKVLRLTALFLCFLSLSPVTVGQQPTQKPDEEDIIRIKTDLVQVRAVVTDRKGQLVDNLKQQDFEILENGKPQTVSFFTLERILGSSSGPVPDSAATTTTTRATVPQKPVRTIILFVDTLHLSSVSLTRAKQQLKQFVDQHVTDQDLVAVVTTSDSLGILQQFHRDKRMMKYAIDKISFFSRPTTYFTPFLAARVRNEDPEALGVATQIMAVEEYGRSMSPPPGIVRARAKMILSEETILRRATLQMLRAVGERMTDLPGQRMIAFMSDGFTLLDEGGAEHDDFVAATSRAARSGVMIYSFNPQGLTVPVEFTAAAPLGGIAFSSYMTESRMDQQDLLRNLAADTGGQAYLNSNDIPAQFKKMLDSNSLYYAFAYYPQADSGKKFRNITVRLRNHPDYKVRTQKGYLPSKDAADEVATTPQQKLFKAMLAPLPLTGLGVTTSAYFLERDDDDAQVTLQIHLDGQLLEYHSDNQRYHLNCEAAVAIFDRSGKVASSFAEPVTASFSREQMERGKQNGFRYNKRIKLSPGLYQIRLGIRDLNGGLMGTSTSWVTVPDLNNRKLTLSGLFLGREIPAEQGNSTSKTSPALIAGQAAFKLHEPIFYRFVLYNAPQDPQERTNLQLKLEVLQSEKAVYVGDWQPLAPRVIRSDRTGIEIGGQLRMQIEPGMYTLRVIIKDQKSGHSTEQSADFELEL